MKKITNSVYRKINHWRIGFIALCALFTCLSATAQTGTVAIGSGTTAAYGMPFDSYNFFNYSQQIVTASEFAAGGGTSGQITGIRFYIGVGLAPLPNWENWTVYIGHTAKTSFSSTSDWEPIANLTQVFAGTITSVDGQWMQITFTTPFVYNGTSNLIVAVDENSPGKTDGFSATTFGTYVSAANTGLVAGAGTDINPTTPPTGTRVGTLARLQFVATLASCLPPSNIRASVVGYNSATLEWAAPQTAPTDGYQYYISTTNTAPAAATEGTNAAGLTVAIGSLAPNTTHYVWVRSKCGTTFGTWIAGTSFKTACNPVTAPLIEEFSTGVIPSCWTTTSSNPVANGLWKFAGAVDYDLGNTRPLGTFAWADGSDPSNINDVTLLTPYIDFTGVTNPEVVFDYFSNNTGTQPNNIFKVDIYNGTTWTNIYTDNTSDENWRTITIPLTAYANSTIRLRFVMDKTAAAAGNAFYNDIALDNVKVRQVPSCIVPTGLMLELATTTSLSAVWTPPVPTPSNGYQYYYSTSATTPAANVTGTFDVPSGNSATIGSLTSATTYYVWVRSNCGNGSYSEWSVVASGTTLCSVAEVPYTENFESVTTPALPVCTSALNEGTGNIWATNAPAAYGFTTKALRYSVSFSAAANAWFFTRAINLTAGTSYRISYKYGGSGYTEKLSVGYGMNADSGSMVQLADHPSITGSTPATNNVDFTPSTTGVYYFGFHAYSAVSQNYLFVDDISVTLSPTCIDPTAFTVGVPTASTVPLSWTASSSNPASGYQYYYSTTNTAPAGTVTPQGGSAAGSTSVTVSGLTPNTTYYIWLRANCGNNDYSVWVAGTSFKTACNPVTAPLIEEFSTGVIPSCWTTTSSNPVANGLWKFAGAVDYDPGNTRPLGTFAWADGSDPSNINDVTLLTPFINLTGVTNPEVVFDYFSNNLNTQPNNIFSVDVFDGTTWTNIYTDNTSDENWRTITIPLTAYANSTIRLRFVMDKTAAAAGNAFYNDIALDNVKVRQVPSCIVPTALMLELAATTSLSAVWTPPTPTPSNGYQYYYSTSTTAPADNITTGTFDVPSGNSATIGNLTPATTYYVWVRSNCGNGSYSEWSQAASATTLCTVAEVPYTENFESVTTPALPVCTSVLNEGTGNIWATNAPAAYGFATKALRYSVSFSAAANAWFFTRAVNLTAGTSYRISYKYGGSGYTEKLNVGYGMNADSGSMVQLADHPSITGSTPATNTVDFTPSTTGVYYFGFHAYSAVSQNYLFVDDISVIVTPTCFPPTAVTAAGTGLTTATVSWTASGTPSGGYQYYYANTNVTPATTVTPQGSVGAGILTANVTGLSSSTNYYIWVRANCGNNDLSAWSQAGTFSTSCEAANVPYTENFESVIVPGFPACTIVVNNGTGNSWTTGAPNAAGFTSNVLRYSYTYNGPADTWFFTRAVNLTAGTTYKITYKYGANAATTYTEKMKVAYGTTATAAGMVQLADHPSITGTTPNNGSVEFTPSTTGPYYFGFQAYSALGQNLLYVDDIMVDAVLGTGGFDVASFKYYPNPVKDLLNLSYISDITSVSVFNLLGQQVLAKDVNAAETAVDMSQLADGTYIVNVTAGDSVKTLKVIKKQ